MTTSAVELKIHNCRGKEVGSRPLAAELFAQNANPGLLHEIVRWQCASRRAGTHSAKTRAEVCASGQKPWRQKGTGRARAGSNSSPLFVGGGVAHGPKPRDYSFSINKKARRLALRQAVSAKTQSGSFFLVDDFGFSEMKTKEAAAVLDALGIKKREKVVVVVAKEDETASKSFRNIPGVKVLGVEGLNVYDLLNTHYLVVAEKVLDALQQRLSGEKKVEQSAEE